MELGKQLILAPCIKPESERSDTSSTINLQTSTRNKFGFITSQVQTIICYVRGICQATDRDVEQEFLEILFCGRDANEGLESALLSNNGFDGV